MPNENTPSSPPWYAPKAVDATWFVTVRTPALRKTAHHFTLNVNRFLQIPKAIETAYGAGTFHERLYHQAQIIVFGNVRIVNLNAASPVTSPDPPNALIEVHEKWQQVHRVFSSLQNGSLKASFTISGLGWIGNQPLHMIAPAFGPQFQSILQTQIIGVWSAFETLAGDLWQQAVNAMPNRLALLRGVPTRIQKKTWSDPSDRETKPAPDTDSDSDESDDLFHAGLEESQGTRVFLNHLHAASGGTFNLHRKMGSVLRHTFRFATLGGIREAYSSAFETRASEIDTPLGDKALDAINLTRNLLVHKSGLADRKYVIAAKRIPLAPKLSLGQQLNLDDVTAGSLVDPVISIGKSLVSAVDAWVVQERKKLAGRLRRHRDSGT